MNTDFSAPILIDTRVLMDDPMVLVRLTKLGRTAFITITILNELENNKTGKTAINVNSRKIYDDLKDGAIIPLSQLPDGQALKLDDRVTRFHFKGCPIFVLQRSQFKAGHNNDRIMELASAYGLPILTRNNAFLVRAIASGVSAEHWSGPESEYKLRSQKFCSSATPSMAESVKTFEIPPIDSQLPSMAEAARANQPQKEVIWYTSNSNANQGMSLGKATKLVGEAASKAFFDHFTRR